MKPIDYASLRRVIEPVGRAGGLPNAFYTDPVLFQDERKRIFEAGWPAAGRSMSASVTRMIS